MSSSLAVTTIITFSYNAGNIQSTNDLVKYVRQKHISHKLLAFCLTDDVVTQYYAYIKSISRQTCAVFDH